MHKPVIILSDLHIHNYREFAVGTSRLEVCIRALYRAFIHANSNSIDYIFFPGDLYDKEKLLPTVVINRTIEAFTELAARFPRIKFIAISGNHDQATKNLLHEPAITALEHLARVCSNFILIDNNKYILENQVYVYGIPYYEHGEHFTEKLKAVEPEGRVNILLIHQTPEGFGLEPDTFPNDPLYQKFDYVYCGHIHARTQLADNFLVVGSPIHRSAEDEGLDKGFIVVDTDNPKAGWELVSLNKLFPIFKTKLQGTPLEEGEEKDFIRYLPPVATKEDKYSKTENYTTNLLPATLLENYVKDYASGNEELLKVGLKFI